MKGYITNTSIGHYGRFANGLFQIAALIGIARKQGFEWGIPEFVNHDHKERFGSDEPIDIFNYLANELPPAVPAFYRETTYPFGYHEVLLPEGNHDLRGHFQSEKYFKHVIDEVRHYLTFKEEPKPSDYIALHVRRGDYDDNYHPLLTLDYYERAMGCFPVGARFLIFSDEMDKAVKLLEPLADRFQMSVAPQQNYIEDFKLMKNCHSFICANSSYSFMAALLANQPGKRICMPKNWFGPAWGDPVGMTKDLYPENAIVI